MTWGDIGWDARPRADARRLIWAAALLLAYGIGAVLFAADTPFPSEFDELAHLSYIRHMAEQPALLARHEEMRLLDPDDLSRWGGQGNYLSHPTAYYLAMSPLLGDQVTAADVLVLRLASTAMGLGAIVLVVGAMIRRIRSDAAFVAGTALLALCPMVGVVAGSLNNDALTLVAGALALCAVLRLFERGPGAGAAVLTGIAFLLAALTKLNAGLLVGVFLFAAHAMALRGTPWHDRRWRGHVAIVAAFGLVGIAPYVVNLFRYGSPVYVDVAFHIAQIPGPEPWAFHRYSMWFLRALGETWSAYEPADLIEIAELILLLALAVLACLRAAPQPMSVTAMAGLAAIAVVLPIHLIFAYWLHEKTLHLSAAQSRYFLAFVPILAFAAAAGLDSVSNARWRRSLASAAIALSLYASLIPAAVRTYLGWRG